MTEHSAPAPPPGPRLLKSPSPTRSGDQWQLGWLQTPRQGLGLAQPLCPLVSPLPLGSSCLKSELYRHLSGAFPLTSKSGLSTCSGGSIGQGLASPASLQTEILGLVL